MKFIIDAWLERPDPHIHIIDAEDGHVQLRFSSGAVQRLLEQGDIRIEDLSQCTADSLADLLHELFLYSCSTSISNDNKANAHWFEWCGNGFTLQ